MNAVGQLREAVGVKAACGALELARSTYYRALHRPPPQAARPWAPSPRALDPEERSTVLEVLHSERFVDRSPAEVYATLLDEERYLCSVRRCVHVPRRPNQEVRERRNQCRHPTYRKPELLATGPNQVWSWDLTKLRAPEKWTYYYLYVVLDVFSRYVVAWMLAHRESGELATRLFDQAAEHHHIEPGQLTVHSSDRGSAPTAKTLAQLYADLGMERSLSRPHVSDDNPFSEAQFKTMKYAPGLIRRDSAATSTHARGAGTSSSGTTPSIDTRGIPDAGDRPLRTSRRHPRDSPSRSRQSPSGKPRALRAWRAVAAAFARRGMDQSARRSRSHRAADL